MKKALSILLVLAAVLGLVACGSGASSSAAGTYYLDEACFDGMVMKRDEIIAMGKNPDEMYLELQGNGKGMMYSNGESSIMEYSGGKIWPVEYPDEKANMTISGNTVKIVYEENSYYLFKKK